MKCQCSSAVQHNHTTNGGCWNEATERDTSHFRWGGADKEFLCDDCWGKYCKANEYVFGKDWMTT